MVLHDVNIFVIIPFKNEAEYQVYIATRVPIENVYYLYVVNSGRSRCEARTLNRSEQLLLTKDEGMYDAWNQGLEFLREREGYVAFMGSDDALNPEFVKAVRCLGQKFHLIYGNTIVVKKRKEILRKYKSAPVLFSEEGLIQQDIAHPGCFFSTKLFYRDRFRYNENYRLAGDLELFLSLHRTYGSALKTKYIDLVQARIGGYGVSRTNRGFAIYKEEYKMIARDFGVVVKTPWKSRIKEKLKWLK